MSLPCPVTSCAPDPAALSSAERAFGLQLETAIRYAGWLSGPGTERGILGPREAGRLWDRHLLNCALAADLLPRGAHVVDIGSGGGLPGIVFALTRPDVRVTLVESMLRRTAFLDDVVGDLGLGARVEVVRGRAETLQLEADAVASRAVAGLATVAAWSAGLVRPGGLLLAIRGDAAADEVREHARALAAAGWQDVGVVKRTYEDVTSCRVVRAIRR